MNELRIRYKDLTQFEKEIICNGCGPKGGFIPVPQFIFKASCNHHDFNYWLGCRGVQRKKADLQFLLEMMKDANSCDRKRERVKYRKAALLYYRAVRTFGWACFHYGRKQRSRIDLDNKILEVVKGG